MFANNCDPGQLLVVPKTGNAVIDFETRVLENRINPGRRGGVSATSILRYQKRSLRSEERIEKPCDIALVKLIGDIAQLGSDVVEVLRRNPRQTVTNEKALFETGEALLRQSNELV
jgi:hypothetical protein